MVRQRPADGNVLVILSLAVAMCGCVTEATPLTADQRVEELQSLVGKDVKQVKAVLGEPDGVGKWSSTELRPEKHTKTEIEAHRNRQRYKSLHFDELGLHVVINRKGVVLAVERR